MDRWKKLYQKMDRASRSGRRAEPDEASRRSLDEWCDRITTEVMEALHAESLERAKSFEQETGSAVTVVYPSEGAPQQAVLPSDADRSFMKLTLGDAAVYLYPARSDNKLPTLHLASPSQPFESRKDSTEAASSRPMHRRLMSTPVCRIARDSGDGYELRSMDSKGTLDLDGVVFTAFEQLVKDWRRLSRQEPAK